ncbi:Uncharacterized protein RNJ44_02401 [Nakaseomyces bracarensis]|uniref:Mitochondrial 15S rRNA processing factor CCM1 n=1 Tax=Nakaseomyces bracarensis TaxID=273131 RepID=A0ABR4NLK3_9SACH
MSVPVPVLTKGVAVRRGWYFADKAVKVLLQKESLSAEELETVSKHAVDAVRSHSLNGGNRRFIMRWMMRKGAFSEVVKVGLTYMKEGAKDKELIHCPMTLEEAKWFFRALVIMKDFDTLDSILPELISTNALSSPDLTRILIGSVCTELCALDEGLSKQYLIECMKRWPYWMKLLTGRADFSDTSKDLKLRATLVSVIPRLRTIGTSARQFLNPIREQHGPELCSEFISTLMTLVTKDYIPSVGHLPAKPPKQNKDGSPIKTTRVTVQVLWNYKVSHDLPINSNDLTRIMEKLTKENRYKQLVKIHQKYPEAQSDVKQFDLLLNAFSKTSDWASLQSQFNALFGVGKLPNADQYGLVMAALAMHGESESVDQLYQQLLRRGLLPNFTVLRAILEAKYRSGDYRGCFEHFELFDHYNCKPTSGTYTLMFKVYRELSDIDGALRLLRRLTNENKGIISEEHFMILIQLCSRFTNYSIAEELFTIMKTSYNIEPSARSISALMNVYIESKLYPKAIHIYTKYMKNRHRGEELSVMNSLLLCYIKLKKEKQAEQLIQDIARECKELDSHFFRNFLLYFIEIKKDIDSGKNLLFSLLEDANHVVNETHFERLMNAYDKRADNDAIVELYKKMNECNIPINSRILLYLIKASYRAHVSDGGNVPKFVAMLEETLSSVANGTLAIKYNKLHPSVFNWVFKTLSREKLTSKAIQLLDVYYKLFFKGDSPDKNRFDNQFITMKAKLVFHGECEQWEAFEDIFEDFLNRIEYAENQPSRTVENIKLRSLFNGLAIYRLRHLVATNQVEKVPEFIKYLESHNFIVENSFLNSAIMELFLDSRTIEFGLSLANDKLIHGFNLYNKRRHLVVNEYRYNTKSTSWLLEQIRKDKTKFRPMIYLKWSTYNNIFDSLDRYLNRFDLEEKEKLIVKYIDEHPYVMKNYLLKSRTNVKNWDLIEKRHKEYFFQLRDTKRVVLSSIF